MKFYELHSIVIVEAICLLLILLIIVAAFKRWRAILLTCGALATIAFFSVWSNIMAFASILVYGSASTLLWWQTENRSPATNSRSQNILHKFTWSVLAVGVTILIMNNLRNIIVYLN